MNKKLDNIIRRMYADRIVRKAIIKRRPDLFAAYYFEHYLEYEIAPFHKEMFGMMADDNIKLTVITGFRESAKSTLMSLFDPIWAVISGRAQFILLVFKTLVLAKQGMKNLKDEFEENILLKRDLGPFETMDDTWGASIISLSKYHAQIMVASRDQAIRGIRHRQYRPQLVIIDDIDDLDSVKTQESRDDTYRWFSSTVMPIGSRHTRFAVMGTPLHEDSLIMRLKKAIESGKRDGIFKSYPIVDENGKALWLAKFPTPEDVEKERRRIGDDLAWQREYLLKIVTEENCVVRPEWIKYYKEMPSREGNPDLQITMTGVDLAISKETYADFTAMVSISVFRGRENNWSIYVHPNPVNEHLYYPETRARLKTLSLALGNGHTTVMYIESVGYQGSMAQDLQNDGFPAKEFQVHGQDKRMRLSIVTHLIENGTVRFAERGNELLINQLTGFGTERHDDLADALAIALHMAMEMMTAPGIVFPKPQEITPPGPVETAEIRKIEEWLRDRELEWKQGRISWGRLQAFQDEARERKWGVPAHIAATHIQAVKQQEEQFRRQKQLEHERSSFDRMLKVFGEKEQDKN